MGELISKRCRSQCEKHRTYVHSWKFNTLLVGVLYAATLLNTLGRSLILNSTHRSTTSWKREAPQKYSKESDSMKQKRLVGVPLYDTFIAYE